MTAEQQKISDQFFQMFYNSPGTWSNPWLGVVINKSPLDLWVYQEIIFQTRPTLIIECGTHRGGSALYFASIFDLLGEGRVVTVDVRDVAAEQAKAHKRIKFLSGLTANPDIVAAVKAEVRAGDRVMLSLDAGHDAPNVLKEMNTYSSLVTRDCYMVVEDGCIGHPLVGIGTYGPYEAIAEFVKVNQDFVIDKARERFLMTFNPNGYMRKVR